jgi:hypothetical protein
MRGFMCSSLTVQSDQLWVGAKKWVFEYLFFVVFLVVPFVPFTQRIYRFDPVHPVVVIFTNLSRASMYNLVSLHDAVGKRTAADPPNRVSIRFGNATTGEVTDDATWLSEEKIPVEMLQKIGKSFDEFL